MAMRDQRVLIFLHLAKTGGISLRSIMRRYVPPGLKFRVLNISGVEHLPALESFKSLPQGERNKIAMLVGHMPFGLHEYFSSECDYITVLRNPVEVITSMYYYIKSSPPGFYWHREIPQLDKMSLFDFVRSDFNINHNHQTRLLSGKFGTFFSQTLPLEADALELAKGNLRKNFRVVGITEQFDQTLLVMKKAFGWKNIFYLRENATPAKERAGPLSPEIGEIMMRSNELDFELWKFAGTLLEESISAYGQSFQDDLRRFRRANAVYQAVYPPYRFGRSLAAQARQFLYPVTRKPRA